MQNILPKIKGTEVLRQAGRTPEPPAQQTAIRAREPSSKLQCAVNILEPRLIRACLHKYSTCSTTFTTNDDLPQARAE